MDSEHQKGVKTLYEEIISKYGDPIYSDLESQKIKAHLQNPRPVAEVAGPVKVKYHSIESDIRDFDTALGYIFSVYPLPAKHTTSDTYLPPEWRNSAKPSLKPFWEQSYRSSTGLVQRVDPANTDIETSNNAFQRWIAKKQALLAIYCRFIELMTDPSSKVGMNGTPTTACIVVGAPPNKGAVKAIMFGSTIRSENKKKLQEHRHAQLLSAYAVKSLPEVQGGVLQKFGHCAETYPYIWNIKTVSINRSGSAFYKNHSERGY